MTSNRTLGRLTRILSMVPWVIANGAAPVTEVKRRFGYTDAELVADLNTVMVCGLPGYGPGELMYAHIDEDEVVIDTAEYFDAAPRPTAAEALTMLASALALRASGEGSAALESAITKLTSVVIPRGEGALEVDLGTEPELVGSLRQAASQHRLVELVHTNLATGETKTRAVEPWAVFSSMGNWYLSAHCRLVDGERMFRIDRIRRIEVAEETFDPPAEPPSLQVGYTPGEDDVRARIELSPAATWVLEYYPVEVVRSDTQRTVIEFSASDPGVIARLLLRLGDRARLLEGPEVAQATRTLGEAILAKYGPAE